MAEPNYNLLNTATPAETALAPIRGMGAVNALQSQQLQNQQSQMEIQNALAEKEAYKQAAQGNIGVQQSLMERGLGKQAAAYGKSVAEAQKLGTESQLKKLELERERFADLRFNPSDQNIQAHLQDSVLRGDTTPEKAQGLYQQVIGMSPEQRVQYFTQMGAKADTVYKTEAERQQRMQGTVPAGYRMTGQGTLEAIPGGPTTTPLAPKDLQKREAEYPAATTALKGYETKADSFVADLQKLRDHPGLDSITGIAAGRLPGVSAEGRAAQALYDKIVAKGGFQALQDLRAMSKTGGALGNVSNQEGKQLVQSFAAIDRRQNAEDVRAALDQVIADVEGSKTRVRDAYDTTYEYKLGGGTPTTGGGNLPGGEIGDALARYRASKKPAGSQ